LHILALKVIAPHDLFDGFAGGQVVEDHRDHHASAANTGLAVTDRRVHRDAS
jgi:hypothetical protein